MAEADECEAARLTALVFGENCSLIDVHERHRPAPEHIGRIVLILLPWNAPTSLTRAWCLCKIYRSIYLSIHRSQYQSILSSLVK